MKIINNNHNKPYQLPSGTAIEMEKPNLFFSEYGEQSVPVELPDSPQNRLLTGMVHRINSALKPSANIPCTIVDGAKIIPARQAVLGAVPGKSISSTFYINDGSFLSKVKDVQLSEIFKGRKVPEAYSIDTALTFCRRLISGKDPIFTIFPVLWSDGSTTPAAYHDSYPVYHFLNEFGTIRKHPSSQQTECNHYPESHEAPDFYNAVDREEKEGEDTYRIPRGFRITPFLRATYVLREVFKHFGYTLQKSLLDEKPFSDLSIVNNCADAIVSGEIFYEDLLPNCMVTTFLEVFRKKFNLEFVADEVKKTVSVLFFRDLLNTAVTDLTDYLVHEPSVSMPESFKQIVLKSEETSADDGNVPEPESIAHLFNEYKELDIYPITGQLFRKGLDVFSNSEYYSRYVYQLVSNSSTPFYEGSPIATEEVVVPDRALEMHFSQERKNIAEQFGLFQLDELFPVIGDVKYLHSSLREVGDSVNKMDKSDDTETPVMLCFATYKRPKCCYGSVTNYAPGAGQYYEKYSDYSLCYVGPDGLFEKFYKSLDELHRNSLLPVKADLCIPRHEIVGMNPHLPVRIHGARLLISSISYTIGKESIQSCTLYTTHPHEPQTHAVPMASRIGHAIGGKSEYYWGEKSSERIITREEYNALVAKFSPQIIFPPFAATSETLGEQSHKVSVPTVSPDVSPQPTGGGGMIYKEVTYWLEVMHRTV